MAMEYQEPPFPQRLEVQLQGVAIGAGQHLRVADADPSVVAGVVQKPYRQVRQAGEQQPFALDLLAQTAHLALQRIEKKRSARASNLGPRCGWSPGSDVARDSSPLGSAR